VKKSLESLKGFTKGARMYCTMVVVKRILKYSMNEGLRISAMKMLLFCANARPMISCFSMSEK